MGEHDENKQPTEPSPVVRAAHHVDLSSPGDPGYVAPEPATDAPAEDARPAEARPNAHHVDLLSPVEAVAPDAGFQKPVEVAPAPVEEPPAVSPDAGFQHPEVASTITSDEPAALRVDELPAEEPAPAEEVLPAEEPAPAPEEPVAVESAAAPEKPSSARRRLLPRGVLIAVAAVVVLLMVIGGVWIYVYATGRIKIPSVVSLNPQAAEQSLTAGRLVAGNARFVATNDFGPGIVIDQGPPANTPVPPGSSVDVTIAVKPASQPVPDVGRAEQGVAEQVLRSQLFVPVVLKQYSQGMPVGQVVAQLPRAGDTAFTGSRIYIVVSLGPGTGGSTVPALVGQSRSKAEALLSDQTLFPYERIVTATGKAADTVVDQVPASGSRLEVGGSVAIAVTSPGK